MLQNAAENLTGYTLPRGWRVRDKIERLPGETGANFSVCYLVERDGQTAFCKVLNFGWIFDSKAGTDPARLLQEATELYNFERDIAKQCVGLSRVVTAIDDGQATFEDFRYPAVSYIIFEVADSDVRRMLNATSFVDTELKFRLLRDLASGVRQLHSEQIAHQDIKPSNLLVFDEGGTQRGGKIGDLGRVVVANRPGPFNNYAFAGDWTYAPPEVLYHSSLEGFGPRRLSADLYQIGGMVSFCLSAAPINLHLNQQLHPDFHWNNWTGTYSEVIEYVRDAMGRATTEVMSFIPEEIRPIARPLLEQLCEVDPAKRGDRKRVGSPAQYSLERFVSALDLLSARARVAEQR